MRRSLVRALARLIVNDPARDVAACAHLTYIGGRDERAASASLYPSRGRDVMAAPKEAPGPLDTATGRTDHGGTRDQRTV